jgi:hypothetical protein
VEGYYSPAHPDHALLAPMDRPHLEARWERSPKVLPRNWSEYTSEVFEEVRKLFGR